MVKGLGVAAAVALVMGHAWAAEQPHVAVGSTGTFSVSSYVEVWGKGSSSGAYVTPATGLGEPFEQLTAVDVNSTNVPVGFAFMSPMFSFGYDPAATPTATSPSGRTNTYALGDLVLTIPVLSGPPTVVSASTTALTVSVSQSRNTQVIGFQSRWNTVDGPLEGSTHSWDVLPTAAFTQTVDLLSLLGTDQGFDLSAFAALPVHLTAPTEFYAVYLGLTLQRSTVGANYSPQLPGNLVLSNFNAAKQIGVAFDGVFAVTVDQADYATPTAYAAASSWVQSNIRQINVESYVSWDIDSLTAAAVPEPSAAWLMALGLPWLVGRHRRSVAARASAAA